MEWVSEHWDEILEIIALIIALANVVVGMTNTRRDDDFLEKVISFLSTLSILERPDQPGTFKIPGLKSPRHRSLK